MLVMAHIGQVFVYKKLAHRKRALDTLYSVFGNYKYLAE